LVEAELFSIAGGERLIRFGDADDFDLGAVEGVFEESLDVAVNETDDADAKRSGSWSRIFLRGEARGCNESKGQRKK
jgi:hypothetical protein